MVLSRRAVLDRFLRFPLSPFSGAEETLNEREDAQLQRPAHGSLEIAFVLVRFDYVASVVTFSPRALAASSARKTRDSSNRTRASSLRTR